MARYLYENYQASTQHQFVLIIILKRAGLNLN